MPLQHSIGMGGKLLQIQFDSQRRELARQWLGFGGNWVSSEIGYDSLGRIAYRSLPHLIADVP